MLGLLHIINDFSVQCDHNYEAITWLNTEYDYRNNKLLITKYIYSIK